MKIISAAILSFVLLVARPASAETLTIWPNGSRPSAEGGPLDYTGSVYIDPIISSTDKSQVDGKYVRFEPGARTAWHRYPGGQTLIVTSGLGWIQERGGPKQEIRPSDVVWIPPGVEHWHGAAVRNGMTVITIQENTGGKQVEWLERVPYAEYLN